MRTNPKERVLVIIDGGNTYQALSKPITDKKGNPVAPAVIGKGRSFSFKNFADYLINKRVNSGIRYYIGIVRNFDNTERSQSLVEGQQKFLQKLQNSGIQVERGRIVYDHSPREKGVDVKIAIDIVLGATNDEYDTVILISSDTDLLPAIHYAQSQGKRIEYVGFSHRYSNALLNSAEEKRILTSADLEPFCFEKQKELFEK